MVEDVMDLEDTINQLDFEYNNKFAVTEILISRQEADENNAGIPKVKLVLMCPSSIDG